MREIALAAHNDLFIAVIALVLLATGCASFHDGPFEVVDGRFFDYRHVSRIQDHRTSESELLEWLGPPLELTTAADGTKVYRYFVVRERKNIESRGFGRRVHVQTVENELVARISGGLVVAHDYKSRSHEATR